MGWQYGRAGQPPRAGKPPARKHGKDNWGIYTPEDKLIGTIRWLGIDQWTATFDGVEVPIRGHMGRAIFNVFERYRLSLGITALVPPPPKPRHSNFRAATQGDCGAEPVSQDYEEEVP